MGWRDIPRHMRRAFETTQALADPMQEYRDAIGFGSSPEQTPEEQLSVVQKIVRRLQSATTDELSKVLKLLTGAGSEELTLETYASRMRPVREAVGVGVGGMGLGVLESAMPAGVLPRGPVLGHSRPKRGSIDYAADPDRGARALRGME